MQGSTSADASATDTREAQVAAMRATMSMPIDTLFGNRVTLEVAAELDNPHDASDGREITNRELVRTMVRVMRYMLDELDHENERERRAQVENAPGPVPPEG